MTGPTYVVTEVSPRIGVIGSGLLVLCTSMISLVMGKLAIGVAIFVVGGLAIAAIAVSVARFGSWCPTPGSPRGTRAR